MIKRFLAIVLLGVSSVFAQTVQTTPNLLTSGTSHTWYGVTTGSVPANYMPSNGTSAPRYDPSTNTVYFSYANASIGQTLAVNQALANVGAGVKVNGYTYSYEVRNMNGDDRQGGVDTFTVSQLLRGPNNSVLLSSNQTHNTKFEWKTVTGSKTATTPYNIADTTYIQFGVSGADNGFWAGYFGPQIRNVDMRLNYTVDPCAGNPAYSPTCANYNTVQYSGNLVPNTTGYAVSGSSIDQSYAINQALGLSGAGATIHGFQWGYQANANGSYCASWFIICLDQRDPSVTTNVNITSSTGASLYSITRTYTNSYNNTSYQYLFPTSRLISTLGNFNFTATTNDAAYIGDMWSKAIYTPDPCSVDPLSSTSCPGYAAAYLSQQCTISALYNTACPGYTVAYFNQQCTNNPLYNQSCPGYASAYLVQQCTINPLYSTTCSGYETAYFNQQCSLNPLYSTRCSGYAQAYHDQQCSLNPLYATDCTGYAQAYHDQQCSVNSLYASDCPGYAAAYKTQQCNANALYATDCPGYAAAYKTQQCSLNALYATDCPGYAAAYKNQQCSLNALYATDCPGYVVAYKNQQCSANPLYATDCPGYDQAYFNAQCIRDSLYSPQCEGYKTAYAIKYLTKLDPAVTTAVNQQLTENVEVAKAAAVATPDPVSSATTNTPSSTSASSISPTATISAVKPAPPPAASPTGTLAQAEPKKEEKKSEDKPQGGPQGGGEQKADGPKPKTAREEIAAKREEAAKKEAVSKGKELANQMGQAADLEAQKAIQNVVIQAMGFTPGFDQYGKGVVPDAQFYRPFSVYGGQKNIDNRTGLRMFGGSDKVHEELVDLQYQIGR